MKTLVIRTKKWLRGGKGYSMLRNQAGAMCCLGFLAKSCGATNDQILERPLPEIDQNINWPEKTFSDSEFGMRRSGIIVNIVSINDDDQYRSLKKRQKALRAAFKELGYRLIFK